MATKPDKENSSSKKNVLKKSVGIKKPVAKAKKQVEEEDVDFEDDKTATKAGKKSVGLISRKDDDDGEEDIEEEDDNLKQGEEDEDWDPDFNEFDLPKSSKKTPSTRKSVKDDDDDFKIDDEFKDLFGSKSSSKKYNEDDDY